MTYARRTFSWCRLVRAAALLIAVFAVAGGRPALAELRVTVGDPNANPLPIAITNFYGPDAQARRVASDIARVVTADLERSGLFKPIDRKAFIQKTDTMNLQPQFSDWKQIGAEGLVHGSVTLKSDGRLRTEFRLWDVLAQTQMVGKAYETPPANWRRVAHIIADAIYKRVTGENGYFDTRIVYIAESGPQTHRIKRLAIMDQDGANHHFLTNGTNLVLTPRFSPSTQEITYLSYVGNRPRVYIYNIDTRRREVVGEFPGMTFAPRFSPDGNKIIMSLASSGNSEIYTMDLRSRVVRRLTNHSAIDTSPSYSPDGAKIVFNSDRGGSQQIYTMNANGGDVTRISFGKGRYATPVWSPRGDLIAFTKIGKGGFAIGVMHPDGSGERLLASGFLVEGPTWAPNGRVLMYFRQDRNGDGPHLYTIDLTGKNERTVATPLGSSDPAWSPTLP
jgi:TolB protein